MQAIECRGLGCSRPDWNNGRSGCIRDVDLVIRKGSSVGFVGPDGSGKGLLLNVIGLLEEPDAGALWLDGVDVASVAPPDLVVHRNRAFGFLFDHPYLLPSFSVGENVAVPLFRIRGGDAVEARDRTREILDFVGMPDAENLPAGRLSRPARWRAALARALVHRPACLIAVSPPRECGLGELVPAIRRRFGTTILWSGDAEFVSGFADRLVGFREGALVSDTSVREAA